MSHPLFEVMSLLEERGLHFTLSRTRSDAVLLVVTVVGERVELSVFEDGHFEYSRFVGNEDALTDYDTLLNDILTT